MSTNDNRTKLIIKKGGSTTIQPDKKPVESKPAKPTKQQE